MGAHRETRFLPNNLNERKRIHTGGEEDVKESHNKQAKPGQTNCSSLLQKATLAIAAAWFYYNLLFLPHCASTSLQHEV